MASTTRNEETLRGKGMKNIGRTGNTRQGYGRTRKEREGGMRTRKETVEEGAEGKRRNDERRRVDKRE